MEEPPDGRDAAVADQLTGFTFEKTEAAVMTKRTSQQEALYALQRNFPRSNSTVGLPEEHSEDPVAGLLSPSSGPWRRARRQGRC